MNRIYQTLALAGVVIISITACNNESTKGDPSQTASTPTPDSTLVLNPETKSDTTISGCYMMTNKRDTANLQIEVKGANVTGPLSYNYFQKDRNDGTFQGEINGTVLTGWYLFRSEGMMSVRQVSWKISNGKLFAGTGEMKERNDSALFINPDKLQFDTTRPFVKVECVM